MPDNINNDYNELAKLIYPSIEASGNVYYGQTRKLAIDELFNINDGGFESSIKTIRRQTDSNEDGFEYISYFCWKFGPLNCRIRIVPCDNDKFIFTFANFPELERIYHLDDTYITNDNTDPIVGTLFIRYKLLLNDNTVEHILNSGAFNSYEKIISLDTNDIRVYITDNCDPTNVDNRDIDDRNIFVKHENDAYYLFVKLCKCLDFESDALYFINMNDGESTVKLIVNGDLQTDYEYYKSHITGWQTYNIGDTITLQNKNDKVYFRGSRSQQSNGNYIQFNITGKLSVGGNINSLLSPDEPVYKNIDDYTTFENANEYIFYGLFSWQSALVDASLLKLNTNKLAPNCYDSMFYACPSLIKAPKLSATTLAYSCYSSMFRQCISLTQAPELPAVTLADSCYDYMFYSSGLIQSPELPATILVRRCYRGMFQFCAFLNYIKCLATDISAEYSTLTWTTNVSDQGEFHCTPNVEWPEGSSGIPTGWTRHDINQEHEKPEIFDPNVPFCIENMGDAPVEVGLYNNSSTKQIRTNCKISYDLKTWQNYSLALAINPTDSLIGRITLANKGDRVYIKADLTTESDANNYTHLTVLNSSVNTKIRVRGNIASLNKGTNDAYKTDYLTADRACYIKMFMDCTALIQAPELPATTLGVMSYESMFWGCTALVQAPDLAATNLAYLCCGSMFQECTALTKPGLLPATKLSGYCYNQMFQGCTALTQAPSLPATTLADSCYSFMFYKCSNLKQAPLLPATALISNCYKGMFRDCTNLTYVKCLATTIPATNCTSDWLNNVSPTGDFYTPAATTWTSSNSGIPTGWTRHDV